MPLAPRTAASHRRLARPLDGVDVRVAPARVGDHEPDQPGSDDEPDDEQPPLNSAFTGREYRERASEAGSAVADARRRATLRGCSTSRPTRSRSSSGPLTIHWYGIGYAIGLAAAYRSSSAMARRRGRGPRRRRQRHDRGRDRGAHRRPARTTSSTSGRSTRTTCSRSSCRRTPGLGRLRRDRHRASSRCSLYARVTSSSVLALGRHRRARPVRRCRPIARWGNFFNQELYGPPTTLPWGIAIDCAHRVAGRYPCAAFPCDDRPRFHPLFLYESLSGLLGAVVAALARRAGSGDRLRPGDLLLIFFIWYGVVRFVLEILRPTTGRSSGSRRPRSCRSLFIVPSLAVLIWRHRPAAPDRRPADRRRRRDRGAPVDRPSRRGPPTAPTTDDADRRALSRARRPDADARPEPAAGRPTSPPPAAGRAGLARGAAPPRAAAPREGLAWLGRPPESRASVLLPARPAWSRGSSSSCVFRFRIRTAGPRAPAAPAATCWSAAAHRGWMDPFVVLHALPIEPRAWFLGSAPVDVHLALAGVAHPPARRAAARLARRRRRRAARRVGAGGRRATAASSSRCPRARVSGPPGRLGPFRVGLGAHRAADGRADRAARDGRHRGALPRPADGVADPAARPRPRRCSGWSADAPLPPRARARSSTWPGG